MDMMKTLLIYLSATMAFAVQSTSAPKETPTPSPAPVAVVESVTTDSEKTDLTDATTVRPAETPSPAATVTKKPTPVPVPTITPNMKGYHNLAMGSKGKDVRKLQEKLIEMKYLPEGAADGAYGRQTYNAVRKFQYYNGLKQDGVAGRATQTNLFENPDVVSNPEASPTPEAAPEVTPGAESAEVAVEDGNTSSAAEDEPAKSELTAVPPELLDQYMNNGTSWTAAAAGEISEEPAEEAVEESAEETTEVPAEETAEELPEETSEEPTEETAVESQEEASEGPAEKAAEESAEEAASETAEEPGEEPVKETEEKPAEEPKEAAEEPAEKPEATGGQEEEREEIVENVDLDADVYESIIGSVALNEGNGPLEFVAMEDGVPVTAKPRLMQNGARIRVSLDDLCQCAEGWQLTDDGVGTIVLEAAGYTLAIYNEENGCSATVDGTETPIKDDDMDFSIEGHFINAEFLAKALKGEAVWEPEESTLMLRIRDKAEGETSD